MTRRLSLIRRSLGGRRCRSGKVMWQSLLLLICVIMTMTGWCLLDTGLTHRQSLQIQTRAGARLQRSGSPGKNIKGDLLVVRDVLGTTVEPREYATSESSHIVVGTVRNQPASNELSRLSPQAGPQNDQKNSRSILSGLKHLSRLKKNHGLNVPPASQQLYINHSLWTPHGAAIHVGQTGRIPTYTKYNVPRADADVSRASHQNLSLSAKAGYHTARVTESDKDPPLGSRALKLITWYNVPYWHMETKGTRMFDGCDVKCHVSENASHAYVSDLVIFHDQNIPAAVPPPRPQNQVWLLFTMEAPPYIHAFNLEAREWRDQVNWTMTYRGDSDIPRPYGRLVRRQTPRVQNWTEVIARKKGRVAWVVSHCGTHSLREKYVRALQQFIQVDVFGSCVLPSSPLEDHQYGSDLFRVIFRDYKFYLSFENSMCRDYITEKFFRSQAEDIVNVVRGGYWDPKQSKERRDAVSTFPEGTFIDSGAFPSAFHLAEYLRYLDRNDTAYEEFLHRKAWYDVESVEDITKRAFCTVCQRLNGHETRRKSYRDVVQWLNDGTCHNPASDLI